MKCQCCGDPAEQIGAGLVPLCLDCWLEKELGVIRNQNISFGCGNPKGLDDDESPGWHDCVKALEDYSGF